MGTQLPDFFYFASTTRPDWITETMDKACNGGTHRQKNSFCLQNTCIDKLKENRESQKYSTCKYKVEINKGATQVVAGRLQPGGTSQAGRRGKRATCEICGKCQGAQEGPGDRQTGKRMSFTEHCTDLKSGHGKSVRVCKDGRGGE